MLRLLTGLLKGAVLGAGVGYGAYHLGLGGAWGYVVYGIVGALVGFLVGRPVWSHMADQQSTIFTSVLKAIFGFGVGAGLFALVHRVLGDPTLALAGYSAPITELGPLFGGAVGALYGAWVEVDDAPAKGAASSSAAPKASSKPTPPKK
jgi:hypothetical protein